MIIKILIILLTAIFLSTPVYAAENDAGDETEPVIRTERNEENNCQVNIEADMPDNFNLDLFVDFINDDTGIIYRLYALNKNDYRAYLFVPDGTYSIIECAVYGDTINKYPLSIPESFILSENDIYTIRTSLINEDQIKREVEERHEEKAYVKDEIKPEVKNKAAVEEMIKEEPVIYEPEEPLPWRKVEKSDGLEADVTVTGLSKDKYDIIIKIVKTGEVNEAEFIYSTDGGDTWSTNQLLKSTFTVDKTGLLFAFPSNDTKGLSDTWKAVYKEDDTIKFHSNRECNVSSSVSKGAAINAYVTGTVSEDITPIIKITKSGDMKTARFSYSLNGGSTFYDLDYPMNEDFKMRELPVVLQFTDIAGKYVVNDTFSFELKGVKVKKDTTYLLYLLGFIVAAAILAWYMWLVSFKEKDSTYRLNVYVPYKKRK